MKYLYTYTTSASILLFFLLGLLSCSNYESISSPNITLQVTRSFRSADDNITSLRIFIFDNLGNRELTDRLTTVPANFQKEYTVKTGFKTIIAVANSSDATDALLATKASKDELINFIIKTEAVLTPPLMMSGIKENVEVKSTGNATITINLIRLVAKFQLNMKKNAELENSEIKVKSLKFKNIPKYSYLFEKTADPANQEYFDHETAVDHTLTTAGQNIGGAIYVFSNLKEEKSETSSPMIEIKLSINAQEHIFKEYINEEGNSFIGETTEAPDHKYSMKRNCVYNFMGEIKSATEFKFKTSVADWILEPSEVVFDKKIPVIEVSELTNNEGATKDNPATLKFKVSSPEDVNWKATLSNGLDFKFDGKSSGTTGELVEIKIVPLKPASKSLRTTELYITFDGEEIDPDGNGSIGIGPGNRYKITQNAGT